MHFGDFHSLLFIIMVKSKRIVAALAYLSIIGVSASPCKPHTTAGPLRQLLLSPLSQ
ncbi:hypothetical protein FOYG_14055 [Fusarium oxysporum NRRL 32931]|uniref:Uncharacterized protein n=1 Tax=Fusarium oxysporum NRRL 32931 TaxID=660029 RepID=W9HTY9_FUSOX|nr:hypothetical protein FOYG_14055 [Fusarium oxysporum NRRL 32931]